MKKLFRIWMYLCTFLVTAQLILGIVLAIWAHFQSDDTTYTTASGEEIEISDSGETYPEILEVFKAVEEKNLETIYRFAAPELKEKVSYELFEQDQWPNSDTQDIQILFEQRNSLAGSDSEHINLILKFRENGSERFGSMMWEKDSGSIHYDTFPFKVTLLSEFGPFPTHITDWKCDPVERLNIFRWRSSMSPLHDQEIKLKKESNQTYFF